MSIKTSMKAAKIAVTSKAGRSLLKTQKQSPHILFAVGVVGVIGTAVLASKATLHLDDLLVESEDHREAAEKMLDNSTTYTEKKYNEDLKVIKLRLARDVVWLYTPAVVCGAATIGAFTGSHVILNRRYTGAVAAYAALDRAFAQYRGRVTELLGEEKEQEINRGAIEVKTIDSEGNEVTHTSLSGLSPYAKLFARETSSAWEKEPDYRLVFLRSQEAWANDRLRARGHLFLNDVYRDLGFEDTTAGAVVGWVYDNPKGGDNHVSFGIFTDHNRDQFHEFMAQEDGAHWLDFNVDGIVYDLIDKK